MKYNLLLWANDIGKFAKELQNKKIPSEIQKLIILGNELKIDDFKALQALSLDELGISYEIDNEYTSNNRDTELILLGRCIESGLGLMAYTSLDKSVQDAAKGLNIPVLNWSSTKSKTNAPKKSIKKEQNIPKEIKTKTIEQVAQKDIPPKTKEVSLSVTKTTKKKTSADTLIKTIIQKSNLKSNEKEMFLKPEAMKSIIEAITNASDVNIGLPFQLQMRFGTNGKLLENVLKTHYSELKKQEG